MKKVWIMNHYASGMFFNKGGRHYAFAKYLKRAGYAPVVFGCNSKHNSDQERFLEMDELWCELMAEEIEVPFVFVQGRVYKGNGKQRVLNMVDFYRNVQKAARAYAKLHGKPDVILASSVHPLTLVAGIQLARHFGVKCICEVRDLWPESLLAFGVLKEHTPFVDLLFLGEHWIYHKADALIFTMEGGKDYILEKGWAQSKFLSVAIDKAHHINNGVDCEVFDENVTCIQLDDEDLSDSSAFKVVYCGSIRKANNLGGLLDLAKKTQNPKIRFLIWGAGDELEALKQRVIDEGISNVRFKGRVAKEYIPYIVSKADLAILNYEMNSIWKYGSSQNKLFEYFASGTPILTNLRMGYDLIDRYHCGFHVDYSELDEAAKLVESLVSMPQAEYETYCQNARQAAEHSFDYRKLSEKLIDVIESL